VFTARYALSPYIKEIRFVFKGLISPSLEANISLFSPLNNDGISAIKFSGTQENKVRYTEVN
jgi:hypothetical protein